MASRELKQPLEKVDVFVSPRRIKRRPKLGPEAETAESPSHLSALNELVDRMVVPSGKESEFHHIELWLSEVTTPRR